jgi:tetratricopeptide (TPR) repeat protein
MSDTDRTTGVHELPGKGQVILSALFGLNRRELDAIEVLGFQLYQQGKVRDAEAIFEGLIALDSRLYRGYAGLGAMALAEQKLEEAAKLLNQAIDRNPDDPTVHANLGETYLRLGKFDTAAYEFEQCMKLDPDQRDPGANRARAIISGMKIVIEELQRQQRPPQG